MAGTIVVDTLKSSAASTPTVFQDSGGTQIGTLCRAWVNFNGTGTVAIRESFNVSSITDNGTGEYTVNFTNAMTDANYAAVLNGGGFTGSLLTLSSAPSVLTSSLRVVSFAASSGTFTDASYFNVAIFR